jgi:multisubunit Na+/H+ antiporter MnhG subunit
VIERLKTVAVNLFALGLIFLFFRDLIYSQPLLWLAVVVTYPFVTYCVVRAVQRFRTQKKHDSPSS